MSIESIVYDSTRQAHKLDDDYQLDRTTVPGQIDRASMKFIALLAYIENETDVEIPLREAMDMANLGDLIDRVEAEA